MGHLGAQNGPSDVTALRKGLSAGAPGGEQTDPQSCGGRDGREGVRSSWCLSQHAQGGGRRGELAKSKQDLEPRPQRARISGHIVLSVCLFVTYPERRFPPRAGMAPAILTCPAAAMGATGSATEPGMSDAISGRQ